MAGVGRISSVAFQTRTLWRMTKDTTLGIDAARAGCARICTLVVDTRSRLGAITIGDAFGTAFDIRISKVFGHTGARSGTVALIANGICAAWTGRAGFGV